MVQIPQAVYDEVVQQGIRRGEPDANIVRLFLQQRHWAIIDVSPELLATVHLTVTLRQGERAVLARAKTFATPLLLMVDSMARTVARHLKISVRGTLGILVQAYRQHLLSLPEVELLIQNIATRPDIWISSQLCQQLLERLHTPTNPTH